MGSLDKSQTLQFRMSFWNEAPDRLPYQPPSRRRPEHHRPTIRTPIPLQRQRLANLLSPSGGEAAKHARAPRKKPATSVPLKGKSSE
jgi:hypothetical protein